MINTLLMMSYHKDITPLIFILYIEDISWTRFWARAGSVQHLQQLLLNYALVGLPSCCKVEVLSCFRFHPEARRFGARTDWFLRPVPLIPSRADLLVPAEELPPQIVMLPTSCSTVGGAAWFLFQTWTYGENLNGGSIRTITHIPHHH